MHEVKKFRREPRAGAARSLSLSHGRGSAPVVVALATVVLALHGRLRQAGSTAAAAALFFTVVMTGLDNPRGLAFGENGALYVAEAGRGGDGPCAVLRGQTVCAGRTGAVTRLRSATSAAL